jgi:hypothetical protein
VNSGPAASSLTALFTVAVAGILTTWNPIGSVFGRG